MLNPEDLRELAFWMRRHVETAKLASDFEAIADMIEQDRENGHALARSFNQRRKIERTEQRSRHTARSKPSRAQD